MVQRRHRIEKSPPVLSVHTRTVTKLFAGVLGVILVLWIIFELFPRGSSGNGSGGEDPKSLVIVEVLNGSGVHGIAGEMSEFLRQSTIDSLITGNADNTDYAETIIIERDQITRHGMRVSELTGIKNITYDYITETPAHVTIILGRDYKNFNPFKQ